MTNNNTLMQDTLNQALDSTGLLSKSQKEIIKYILSFDLNKGITSHSIQNYTKSSKQAVNNNLNILIKRDFLYRKKDRIYMYYCNEKKIQEIVAEYNKSLE
jgi:Fic family protein